MTARQLMYQDEARAKMLAGVKKLADCLRFTLGPSARAALVQNGKKSVSMNDGVAIAKEVSLEDPFEEMGVKLVREVADKLADEAGDGTTSSTLLAEAILSEGLRLSAGRGLGINDLQRGIEKAVAAAEAELSRLSRPISSKKEFKQVASVSADDDEEIAEIIATAFDKVGRDGAITVEDGQGRDCTLETIDGVQWDKGWVSQYFVTEPATQTCKLENPYILLFEKKISSLMDLVPLLQKVIPLGRPLFIVAEDVEGDALQGLAINSARGVMRACAVKAPGFGNRRKQILEDLAVFTGGKAVTDELGVTLPNVELEHLGQAASISVGKDNFSVLGGKGDSRGLDEYVGRMRKELEETKSKYDREKIEERIAKLAGGVAIVKIGGATEFEMKSRKTRAEDAMHAVTAAAAEGVVPGGGTALLAAAKAIRALKLGGTEGIGADIVANALSSLPRQIAINAGYDGDVVVDEMETKGFPVGFDARTGTYVNMFEQGVIDPAKVVKLALRQAASVAGSMLTTDAIITDLMETHEENPIAGSVM